MFVLGAIWAFKSAEGELWTVWEQRAPPHDIIRWSSRVLIRLKTEDYSKTKHNSRVVFKCGKTTWWKAQKSVMWHMCPLSCELNDNMNNVHTFQMSHCFTTGSITFTTFSSTMEKQWCIFLFFTELSEFCTTLT